MNKQKIKSKELLQQKQSQEQSKLIQSRLDQSRLADKKNRNKKAAIIPSAVPEKMLTADMKGSSVSVLATEPKTKKVAELVIPVGEQPIVAGTGADIDSATRIELDYHSDSAVDTAMGVDNYPVDGPVDIALGNNSISEQGPIVLGQEEFEVLQTYRAIHDEMSHQWHPPAGLQPKKGCIILVTVANSGKIERVQVEQPSGVLAYDIAARMAVNRAVFPKSVWSQQIRLHF